MGKRKVKGTGKWRRLTIEDRIEIACLINEGMSLSKIAKHLRRPRSAVTREVKRNSTMGEGEREFACPLRANGLCNRCRRHSCGKGRRVYEYLAAEEASTERRSSSRVGPRLPKEALDYIDAAVSEGVALGQSIHHIYASDQKLRGLASERTVRRLCVEGRLSTKPHQLRRCVRYKRAAAATRAFAINLADNGSEFATLYKMEEGGGRKVRSVFSQTPTGRPTRPNARGSTSSSATSCRRATASTR